MSSGWEEETIFGDTVQRTLKLTLVSKENNNPINLSLESTGGVTVILQVQGGTRGSFNLADLHHALDELKAHQSKNNPPRQP